MQEVNILCSLKSEALLLHHFAVGDILIHFGAKNQEKISGACSTSRERIYIVLVSQCRGLFKTLTLEFSQTP